MRRVTPAIALLLLLAGCSPGPVTVVTVTATASASQSSPTPEPSANGWDNAQAFAGAALKGNYEEAKEYAAAGSAAERYLTHMAAINEAMVAAGDGGLEDPDDITYDAATGTVSYTYTDADMTTEWNRFEYDSAGKVISWSTGKSDTKLSERLWTKPAKASVSHASVELVSAYKNDSGLFVVLDVKAKDRSITPDCGALLDDSKHRQREAAECSAPERITKGSSGYVALTFEGAAFGGTLRYNVEGADYDDYGTVKLAIR